VLTKEEAVGWNLFPAIVKPAREHCSLTLSEKSVVSTPLPSGTDSAGE